MPWRGPNEPGEFPTLGRLVGTYIQERCAVPDGDHVGQQYILTAEMVRFLLHHYRIDPVTGRFRYRRSQLKRPQKWGKGPFSAAMICAEAAGPVLFAGWDAQGEPVGREWATPWIQVTAVSEDQTDNVWRALIPMIELGDFGGEITDYGITRINLPGGGRIEPVTASAPSRLGQRITFAVQDQTESWFKRNGGHRLADNQRRNLAGMSGRSIETTNAWDPAERSVAQLTAESAVDDIYLDHGVAVPGSFRNKRERRRAIRAAYGDSWWVDLDTIDAEAEELVRRGEVAQAERFFGNRVVSGGDVAFDVERWQAIGRPDHVVPDRALITLGFDGARFKDSTALVATEIATGYQWVHGLWERPTDIADDEPWEVPEPEVHARVDDAFRTFRVWRMYADPPWWDDQVDRWSGRYGQRVVRWWTHRLRPMAGALRAFRGSMGNGELSHDGSEAFARHIANCRKTLHPQLLDDDGVPMWTIAKERPGSPLKIDAAMAACLSWEARGDALAAGLGQQRTRSRVAAF